MPFLDSLVSAFNQQAGFGENSPSTFNYNSLGPFAEKIDRTAQRLYVDTGLINKNRPNIMETLWQQPDLTVIVKKRHFTSLAENFRLDLLNKEEKLYLKSIKKLFQKKCQVIAAYEQLTKFEYLASQGITSNYALPLIFSAVDFLNQASPGLISGPTQTTLEQIRNVFSLSNPSLLTAWTTTSTIPSEVGDGTGTFELTLVNAANWTNSIRFGGGSADLSIEDPLGLMIISSQDVDQAISDAANLFQTPFFKQTETELQDIIELLMQDLKKSRIDRNVSQIKIIINQQSLLQKKVRLIMDEEGKEILFSFNGGFIGFGSNISIDSSIFEGRNAVTTQEHTILEQLLKNIYTLLAYQQTSRSQIQEFNNEYKYVRQRMYQEFDNRAIIQPMDQIHIFVNSRTKIDQNALKGFNVTFSDNSMLSQLDKVTGKIQNSINDFVSAFGGSENSYLEQERDAIAGPDFPLWLWGLVRNDFTRQAAGQHRFAGVVERVPDTQSGGQYTLRVSARDLTYYLNMGQTNIKPALDAFDSAIFDPLTPFDLDFDSATGFLRGEFPKLLDENEKLLLSGAVKYKTGRNIGKIVTKENFQSLEIEQVASNLVRRKFNNPDGFVYRWKRGISSTTLFGQPHSKLFQQETVPSLTNDPFAGQDVMNVLSLLITGQPYNFNTFLKSALVSGNLSRDDLFNKPASNSYFRSLIGDLARNNSLWGNFIPFKKMIINESGYNFLRSGEYDLSMTTSKLSQLLTERAKRFDALTAILPAIANNPQFYKSETNFGNLSGLDLTTIATLGQDIIELDLEIEQQKKIFEENLKSNNLRSKDGSLKIFGDDIFFDPTTSESAITVEQKAFQREKFRKKISLLTQRRLWKVKANTDQNLLIIDDSYDKNYDIQAFEKTLTGGLQTFRSTYSKIGEKIEGIAQMLGLEVFANTQGHIEIRPPQYNRIPSSILASMLQQKNKFGFQLFPNYLQDLFFNQIQGLTQKIEIIEDEIRLRGAALGFVADDQFNILLGGAISGVKKGQAYFSFVTGPDGKLGSKDLQNIIMQANPEIIEEGLSQALNELDSLVKIPNSAIVNFDIIQRTKIINEIDFDLSREEQINDRIQEIRKRLELKTGITPPEKSQLLPNDRSLVGAGRSQFDILSLTNQISQFISERQGLLKLLTNAIKNLDQGINLNKNPDEVKNLLYPTLYQKNKNFPEILEHLIEDENNDDLGINSGKRFIIKDSLIKSVTLEANPPPFTVIEVNGSLENALVQTPSGLEIGQSGNGIATAIAADNDLWRQFGFRGYNAVYVPFLSDPEAQCAPYSVFLLNQARKNILHANMSLVGNEYYQPGEVYYLEHRDLLFYAESVSENFTYNQDYSCSMNLIYGHKPGEFIPTMLDLIGKALYTNKHQGNLIRHVRNSNIPGEEHICVMVHDNATVNEDTGESVGFDVSIFQGKYGKQNQNALSQLILMAGGYLSNEHKIELRLYHSGNGADFSLKGIADGVKYYLTNPFEISESNDSVQFLPDNKLSFGIRPENISIIEVNIKDPKLIFSPSSEAWSMARTLSNNNGNELDIIYTKIIDIWINTSSFESSESLSTENINQNASSQIDQELKNKYIQQFTQKLQT